MKLKEFVTKSKRCKSKIVYKNQFTTIKNKELTKFYGYVTIKHGNPLFTPTLKIIEFAYRT